MKQNDDTGCCSGAAGCGESISDMVIRKINLKQKQIIIDFLFLDLSVCTR